MDNTKREMKKHADLIKKFVLSEAAKIQAHYGTECGNCVDQAAQGADLGKVEKVKEDNGITAKIETCDKCEKEPCECEKIEESISVQHKKEIISHLQNAADMIRSTSGRPVEKNENMALMHIEKAIEEISIYN